jgi:hypothetical protein
MTLEFDFGVFMSPRGWEPPFDGYRSLFGFIWWFWLPRIHTQKPDMYNPIVLRFIWLCFAINLDIWTEQSKPCWPSNQKAKSK